MNIDLYLAKEPKITRAAPGQNVDHICPRVLQSYPEVILSRSQFSKNNAKIKERLQKFGSFQERAAAKKK